MTVTAALQRSRTLTAAELLTGAELTHRVSVPGHLLTVIGTADAAGLDDEAAATDHLEVVVRPLLLADVIRLHRASGDDEQLASALIVQQTMVDPPLTIDQVHRLPAGLVEFLLGEVNRISGLSMTSDDLQSLVREPVARACLVLAREFGWTPDQCTSLTVGQLLVYLEMAGRGDRP